MRVALAKTQAVLPTSAPCWNPSVYALALHKLSQNLKTLLNADKSR
jgi:hypothetical protein